MVSLQLRHKICDEMDFYQKHNTPIFHAIQSKEEDILNLLFDYGARISSKVTYPY